MAERNDKGLQLKFELERPDFSLAVDAEFSLQGITGLYGRSGAGKTSLLRCTAGLDVANTAYVALRDTVLVDSAAGVEMPVEKRRIAYVFQEPRLFAHLSVEQNLRYGAKRAGEAVHQQEFEQVTGMLGLEPLLDRHSSGLSGGEAQRVAIGRALLSKPELLLMDEPLASVDEARKQELLPYLDGLHRDVNLPVIYVSHNIDEICRLCDHLAVMDGGRIVAHGDLQSVLLQTDVPILGGREASAIVKANVLSLDAANELAIISCGDTRLQVAGEARAAGAAVTLRILANDVSLCLQRPERTSILNILAARVEGLQDEAGGTVLVHLKAGDLPLLARVTKKSCQDLALQAGASVFAQIKSISIRGSGSSR